MFGLNLLLPFFAVVLCSSQPLKDRAVQVLLSLLAAGWYCGLIVLYHLTRQQMVDVLVGDFVAVTGTIVAAAALYRIARARGYRLVAPLAVATVLGTIWFIVSLPCAAPYM
jgi:hypothetical protein